MNVPVVQHEGLAAATLHEIGRQPATVMTGFFDLASFELMQRVAKGFASSTLVPAAYQGNTAAAISNCMIALNLAQRIGADPLMVMQNLSIVQGRPAWSSQFLIASVNTCGRFTALRFEFFGTKGQPDWGCRASAIEKATGEMLVGADITMELAHKEGWTKRNGSKWPTMPQQMLMYRAGAWWTKAYAPELSMGLPTADEARDAYDDVPATGYRQVRRSAVNPVNQPPTIEGRLEAFANEADANLPSEQPDTEFAAVPSAAETPAEAFPVSQAGAPAASSSAPEADAAGSPDDPVEAARAAGRRACRDGKSHEEIPERIARYKKLKEAWADGYNAEGERMEAEMNQ